VSILVLVLGLALSADLVVGQVVGGQVVGGGRAIRVAVVVAQSSSSSSDGSSMTMSSRSSKRCGLGLVVGVRGRGPGEPLPRLLRAARPAGASHTHRTGGPTRTSSGAL
jgi:hypothetical protein